MERRLGTKRLLIVVGSKNDIPHLKAVKVILAKAKVPFSVEIISAHRNVKKLVSGLAPTRLARRKIGCVLAVAHSVANLPAVVAGYLKDAPMPVVGVGLARTDADKIEKPPFGDFRTARRPFGQCGYQRRRAP